MAVDDASSFTRRAWARLLIWGAGGLSLLPASLLGCKRKQQPPTCYAPPPPDPKSGPVGTNGKPVSGDGALARWRELGSIWRELSAHSRGKYEREEGEEKLKALEVEMAHALSALPASAELRTIFEERAAHVQRTRYVMATCYEPMLPSPAEPRERVEEQMSELRRLQDEGKLTREAAGKAARALAVQAQYMTGLRDAEAAGPQGASDRAFALWDTYRAGALVPGDDAQDAGRHVVELEVGKPGLLTEEPE